MEDDSVEVGGWLRWGVVSPGCVVVDLVQQSISQHSSVLVYEDVFAAVDADQQTDDVRRAPLPAQFFCRETKSRVGSGRPTDVV